MRRLWLVRHGESTWNALGLVQGQAEGPLLNSAGRRQAEACARLLAPEPVRAVYASDLERAASTAAVVAEALELPVAHDPRLRERSLGDAEAGPIALLGPERSGVVDGQVVDADAAPARGESIRQLFGRVVPCVEELVARHGSGDLVVVCHGGVVRVVLAWLEGRTPDDMAWPEIENARPIAHPLPEAVVAC